MDPSRSRDFTEFYDTTWPRTVACAYAMTGILSDAEDIAQEAYSRAWPRWSSLRDYDDPGAWVRQVATRLAISRLRRARTAGGFLARSRGPEPAAPPSEATAALVAALKQLPEAQRRAIVLHHLGDLPLSEIARIEHCPEGTVKARLSRGRAASPSFSLPRTENPPMPDLDQLLDTLVADVTAGTRAPGAATAIRQARRRRAKVAVATAGAVAFIAVGGGLVAGNLGGSDRISPIDEPTLPSSEPPTGNQSAETAPDDDDPFAAELRRIVAQAPNWTLTDTASFGSDSSFAVCAGDWSVGGFGGGTMSIGTPGEPATAVSMTHGVPGVPSAAKASEAATRLVENLASCTDHSWRTQPIADTGAVLAFSADGVVWIHHRGAEISTLEVGTTDGPPPPAIQIEVANLMWSDLGKSR